MKRRLIPFAFVTAALIFGMCVSPISAYFTDWHSATGGLTIRFPTDITEVQGNRQKQVTLHNSANSTVSVYVRMRVFASEPVTVTGENWPSAPDDDGWYVYGKSLAPDESAATATVQLNFPEGATENDEYNVIVVYESTPMQEDSDGNTYADWSKKLDTVTEEGGN